ncbi:sulfotransferase family protein [Parvularcula dongshanensis]|uniref:Sulfotransferase n=1 Tax=Parvularcula dongshanensis TaxID=1173995 RepID=A0A840I401_9PROT|nr:sulfotransferase [Parvularcula dongshanensis]MBB4658924.1 hypothetical protein [Parvularcula dongshanensis]
MTPDYGPRLLILCGALRSGTTLLRLMLGQHPQLLGRGESDFLFDGISPQALRTGGTPDEQAAFAHNLATARSTKLQGVTPPGPGPIRQMMEAVLAQEMPQDGLLLLTLHRHFDIAAHAFPNARFVHLVRDPRDVALSSMRMGWAGNAYHGVGVWLQAEQDWQKAKSHLDAGNGTYAELTFEDLTSAPESALRSVLQKVDLPFHEAVLTPPGSSTYSAPKANRIKTWQNELSPQEAAEINWRLREIPDDERYDRKTTLKPSPLRALQLGLESKIGRQRFAIDRYGLPLWTAEHVARRLRLPNHARLMDRIEAINIKLLK